MYADHATTIQRECRASVSAFQDTLIFVLATIQQHLETVPDIVADIREQGESSRWLFGMKRQGYRDIKKHGAALHSRLFTAATLRLPLWRERALIDIVSTINGINLAKAGFVLQLVLGETGCLDTHNRRRFGLSKVRLRPTEGMKYPTMLKHARTYVAACDAQGGCAALWDSWCQYVAERRSQAFSGDAEHVSALHLCAVNPF